MGRYRFFYFSLPVTDASILQPSTIIERQYFSAMKKHMEFWENLVHKDSKSPQHVGFPDLFTGNHLLTAQNLERKCYIIDQFIGAIAE